MRPCQKCGQKNKNGWSYGFRDDTRKVTAVCKSCGFKVEFNAKPRKPYDPNRIGAKAEYEMRDGKMFLKIDGEFKEVDLYDFGKFWRVCPVDHPYNNKKIGKRVLWKK
jgi:DNA-directed RNA polymerase subunit RPC12/RpoP